MADASPPDARRLAARRRSTRRSSRPGSRGSATGSSSSTTPARSGPATGEPFTFQLFPNRFVYSRDQNRASAPYLTVDARARGPAAARGARRDLRSSRGRICRPARRSSRGSRPATPGRPARSASSRRSTARHVPRELIPMAGGPATGSRCTSATWGWHRVTRRIASRSAPWTGRGTSARRRRRDRPASPTDRAAPLPGTAARAPPSRRREAAAAPGIGRGRRHRRAGQGPPVTGRVDPPPAGGLPRRQSPLGRRRARIAPPRGAERVRRLPGRCSAARPRIGIGSRPELTFDGPAGRAIAGRVRPLSAVPTRGVGPLPDPIVPLDGPKPTAPRRRKPAACTSRSMSRTTPPPGEHRGTLTLHAGRRRRSAPAPSTCGSGTSPCPTTSASCPR